VVLTIEPGLYIPDDEAFGPFAGIGVRIEDDVAITGALLMVCSRCHGKAGNQPSCCCDQPSRMMLQCMLP